jgi:hypothetical protein
VSQFSDAVVAELVVPVEAGPVGVFTGDDVPSVRLAVVIGSPVGPAVGVGLGPADGVRLALTLGLAAVTCGVPLLWDVIPNAAPAPAATSANDVVETMIRLRMVRSLPRMRAADAPAVCAAPAASSTASESVVSKSLDTVRSPFG